MREEKEEKQTKIVDYELSPDIQIERPERKNLSKMEDETIVIEDIRFHTSKKYGDYIVIRDMEGQEYYTFSKVAYRQAQEINEVLSGGNLVAVSVKINRDRQVYFSAPNKGNNNRKKK